MKIALFDLYTYLIFLSLFKAYFIPNILRQTIKIVALILLFVFLVTRMKKKDLCNLSLLFSSIIIISGMYNYISGSYTIKALMDSLLYALTFYDLYSFFIYANKHDFSWRMSRNLYRANLIYCLLTIISVLFVGVENNSNIAAYMFGNKFTSSYLFISLIALYGLAHNMNLKRNKRIMCVLITFGVFFTVYTGCATATIALIVAVLLFGIGQKLHICFIQSPFIAVSALIGTSIVPFVINILIKINIVKYIIFDVFRRSITIYGRFEIYNNYLYSLLKSNLWLGYGYSNGVMMDSTGVFSNAQNGLLEQMMNFGFIGVMAILITVFCALKKKKELSYMSILLYAMIVAAIFEVTINWFFWVSVFSIQWLEKETNI